MRIERLDLTRYGAFTGRTLDFSRPVARDAEAPDLHVIYGPNEAGKSTLFSAWLDLLFGTRGTSYDFEHRDALEIGARIALDGASHDWTRSGLAKGGTLLAAGGAAVDAADLAVALGGLERNDYATMFSLDTAELEEGGRAILSSEGRLGELLFSAGSGLSGLTDVLLKASDDAAALFKSGGQKYQLRALEQQIEALDERLAEVDTRHDEFERLIADREEAARIHAAARAEHEGVARRTAEIERLLDALIADDRRREAEDALAALGDLPEAEADWFARADDLASEASDLASRAKVLDEREAAQAAAAQGIERDEAALGAASALDALSNGGPGSDGDEGAIADPQSRMRTACADLPRRAGEVEALDEAVRDHLDALGIATPHDVEAMVERATALRLRPDRIGSLRDLSGSRSGTAEALRVARSELSVASDAFALAADAAGAEAEDGPSADGVASLDRMARRMRRDALARLAEDAVRKLERERSRVSRLLGAIGVANGTDLARLAPPSPARRAGWRDALEAIAGRRARMQDRVDAIRTEREALRTGTATLAVPGDAEARASREAREAAWRAHRDKPTARTASAFEAAMHSDDEIGARRLAAAADLARLRAAEQRIGELDAEEKALEERGVALDAERGAIDAEIGEAADALEAAARDRGAGGSGPLGGSRDRVALDDYAERHAALTGECDALGSLEDEAERAAAAADGAREALSDLLATLDLPADGDLDTLVEVAEAFVDTQRARSQHTAEAVRRRDAAEAELNRRKDALELERERDRDWRARWRHAVEGTFLAEHPCADADADREPDTGAILALIDEATALHATLDKRRTVERRMAQMRADRDGYLAALSPVARSLGLDEPTLANWAAVHEGALTRVAKARESERMLRDAERELGLIETARIELDRERAAYADRIAAISRTLGTDDPREMQSVLRTIAKRDEARRTRDDAMRTIMRKLRLTDEGEALGAIEAADRDALGSEGTLLAAERDRLAGRLEETAAALARATMEIERVGADDLAARLASQRQAIATEMEDVARCALRLEFGIEAAKRALHRYRERHRSQMMARASEAFATISCGGFGALGTRAELNDDRLVAIRPDGRHVEVSARSAGRGSGRAKGEGGLSKGTRHQLYLALRVAGYHEFAARRAPPPFLCDDIMETFDDERAAATLRLLGGMARRGQVIILTHHRHLAEIAGEVVPGTRVHELPGLTGGAEPVREAAE